MINPYEYEHDKVFSFEYSLDYNDEWLIWKDIKCFATIEEVRKYAIKEIEKQVDGKPYYIIAEKNIENAHDLDPLTGLYQVRFVY